MLHMKSKKSQQNNNNSNKTLIGVEGPLHEVHRFSDQELKWNFAETSHGLQGDPKQLWKVIFLWQA